MNLNITPIDKISNELAAIDSYLNITMSEEVQEAVLRGNDLAVYIARALGLIGDALAVTGIPSEREKEIGSLRYVTGNSLTCRGYLQGSKCYH